MIVVGLSGRRHNTVIGEGQAYILNLSSSVCVCECVFQTEFELEIN